MSPDTHSELHGVWALVRAELDGEAAPELVITQTELVIRDTTYQVRFAGTIVEEGRLEIHPATETRQMTWHGTSGANVGRKLPTIYQIKGDRLRICYGLNGQMPAAFGSAPGASRYVATYRRTTEAASPTDPIGGR